MKSYDYKKAKHIIEESKDCLESASLGMHEDWFWTAETIWENGEFKRELPDNAIELENAFLKERENGLSIFLEEKSENGLPQINPKYTELSQHRVGGILSSNWATPTLNLVYKDGNDKMIPCFITDGEEMDFGEKVQMQIMATGGCLSSDVQSNITPLE